METMLGKRYSYNKNMHSLELLNIVLYSSLSSSIPLLLANKSGITRQISFQSRQIHVCAQMHS